MERKASRCSYVNDSKGMFNRNKYSEKRKKKTV